MEFFYSSSFSKAIGQIRKLTQRSKDVLLLQDIRLTTEIVFPKLGDPLKASSAEASWQSWDPISVITAVEAWWPESNLSRIPQPFPSGVLAPSKELCVGHTV